MTGTKSNVPKAQGSDSDSDSDSGGSRGSNRPSSSNTPTPTESSKPSTITQAGQTVVITATGQSSASDAAATLNAKPSGPNKGAIAAGVIVGLLAVIAIAVGAFFFLRSRKRRAIEEEYRRNAAMNGMAGGKPESPSSMGDSRLEPSVMLGRRMSDGSIADNQDYSRRILKVSSLCLVAPP